MGEVPHPLLDGGVYILDILFYLGPFKGDIPLSEEDFDSWERRRGIALEPWEAEMLVHLSHEYMRESRSAKVVTALSPWPPGRRIWMEVTSAQEAKADTARKEAALRRKQKEPNVNRKRY